jgi:hypothetical protein
MIREALEHGGVEFIAGHEPGVKLKTTRRGEAARAGLDSRLSNRTSLRTIEPSIATDG